MFLQRLASAAWFWFTPATLATVLTLASGCGSVGPSQRTPEARSKAFAGVECEPGLVLECEPACSRGEAQACEIAGLGYLEGKAVNRDLDRARIMLERACDKGQVLACSGWAKMAEDNQGVELSPERRATLLGLGCDKGDANACYRLGRHLLGHGKTASTDNLARAHELFDKACSGDDAHGCMELGVEAKTGRYGAKDVVKAVTWLTDACDGDVAKGCFELGDLQVAPATAVHNPALGRSNLDKACTLGAGVACERLALLMETGEKNVARAEQLHTRACDLERWNSCLAVGRYQLAASPAAAERAFDKACRGEVVAGCFERAKLLDGRSPGIETAPDEALPLYEKACAKDLLPACSYAAHLALERVNAKAVAGEERERLTGWVRKGCEVERQDESCLVLARWLSGAENGLSRDNKRASELLGPLCAKAADPKAKASETALGAVAYGEACHRLGRLHETGVGIEQNVLGASTLYDKGCSAGYKPACLAQAVLLWRGTGGHKKDPELAVSHFKRLCGEQTSVGGEACIHLGFAQMTGVGTARDLEQAKSHFETGCNQGQQLACAHLGHYLTQNRGTEADRKRGEGLLRSACDSANGQGCFYLADLPRLTKTQRKELIGRACQLDVVEACAFQKVSSP